MLPDWVNFALVKLGPCFVCIVKSLTQTRPPAANKVKDGTLFDRAPVCVCVSLSLCMNVCKRVLVYVCMSVFLHALSLQRIEGYLWGSPCSDTDRVPNCKQCSHGCHTHSSVTCLLCSDLWAIFRVRARRIPTGIDSTAGHSGKKKLLCWLVAW